MAVLEGARTGDAAGVLFAGQARELYDDPRLMPLLRRLIKVSCGLTRAAGGSISIVDAVEGRYRKVAEHGTACRLGQTFPMDEGVSGEVLKKRRPIVLAAYRDLVSGHLPAGHPAVDGSVAAIPIWWLGDVVGVNVIFAGRRRHFTPDEIDQLEALTQYGAPGLVAAAQRDLSSTYFPTRRGSALADPAEAHDPAGSSGAGTASVERVALGLVALSERAARRAGPPPVSSLHVAVVPGEPTPRLLVHGVSPDHRADARTGGATADDRWQELFDAPDGGIGVKTLQVDELLTAPALPALAGATRSGPGEPSPFSPREQQVAGLLARGLSDRAVAQQLVISPKTVEKHVGAVLRKTGATSRTAAVVRALAAGWLDRDDLRA